MDDDPDVDDTVGELEGDVKRIVDEEIELEAEGLEEECPDEEPEVELLKT